MELYHALNRGVDGRELFTDDKDRVRFVHDLYVFNDRAPQDNTRHKVANTGFVNPYLRKQIVDIHGWVLMKNHYHLLLSERIAGGISLFLRKLNVGYANYFNDHYKRNGTLFQGRTKKILITQEAHFLYILHYLHLNPLDYLEGAEKWRERSKHGIKNMKIALEYMERYRWSSYLDYAGIKNFPSILTKDLFQEACGDYAVSIREYLRDAEVENISTKFILE